MKGGRRKMTGGWRKMKGALGRNEKDEAVLRIRDVYPGSQIPDPDFYPSRIPDPGSRISDPGSRIPDPTQEQKRGMKKNILSYLFCSQKFNKLVNYFIFEMLKKKIWANFQRIIELFTQKLVTKLSKIWVWDPGSGAFLTTGSGSGIRIRNTG